jgi:polyhydroxyalkanoate synthase
MISWRNPDKSFADKDFNDYLEDGLLQALKATLDITNAPSAHLCGYCIGGTLLAMAASYLTHKKQSDQIASLTFLTTLLDFEHAGELKYFIDEHQIALMEQQMREDGVLSAKALKTTFSMLRANDLIWSFMVNNYLMGRDPLPFDLLYWNNDSTNLPAKMHCDYLRDLYLNNKLIQKNGFEILGHQVDLNSITSPCYFLSTKEDHIAPWKATFSGFQSIGAKDKHFTLGGSGHIAGVINPPAKNKYGFQSTTEKTKTSTTADDWLKHAQANEGSWWPNWHNWLLKQSSDQNKSPKNLGNQNYSPICNAPGEYVFL